MDCTVYGAKTLINCGVNTQLFCTFVFANAKSRLSHDAAHMRFTKAFCLFSNVLNKNICIVIRT